MKIRKQRFAAMSWVCLMGIFCMLTCPEKAFSKQAEILLDVPGNALEEGDMVEVRGTFSGEYSWDNGYELVRIGPDRWGGSLPISAGGRPFEYKYVIVRGNGEIDWEVGSNRIHTGTDQINDIFRGFGGQVLAQTTTVEIRLNTGSMSVNAREIDRVGIMGERGTLSWELPEQVTLMRRLSGSLWLAELTFEAGTLVDIPFKFALQADEVWQWEELPGHIDHLLIVDPQEESPKVEYAYNPDVGHIRMVSAQGLRADDYRYAVDRYGGSRRYGYMLAIELLKADKMSTARQVYERHRQNYDPVYLDDFDFLWAWKLAELQGLEQALMFVEDARRRESNEWRRVYYHYLEGELLLEEDHYEQARQAFRLAIEQAPEQDSQRLIRGYAQLGMARSFVRDTESDQGEVLQAQPYLEDLAKNHPREQVRRMAWQHLADIGRQSAHSALHEQAMEGLMQTGSRKQRLRSQVDALEYRFWQEPPDSMFSVIQQLDQQLLDPEQKTRLDLLQAEVYMRKGLHSQAVQLLREVAARGQYIHLRQRANHRLQQLTQGEK